MKTPYTPLILAVTSLFTLSPIHGGEWHSAGNSPAPPYHPRTPAHYKCHVIMYTVSGKKTYRIDFDRVFHPEEFLPPGSGTASHTVAGEADPGMNGQQISMRFSPNTSGGEDVHLEVSAHLPGVSHNSSSTHVDRSIKRVSEKASVNVESANAGSVSYVSVEADCTELDTADTEY
ncbi:MAG: hypothetical protein AB7G93_04055 [Bdellovibrionales bacterium]